MQSAEKQFPNMLLYL